MSNLNKAFQLYREDKYEEAVKIYKDEYINNNLTDVHKGNYARALYKINKYKESYGIYEELENSNYKFDDWKKKFYADTCRKAGEHEKGLKLCEEVLANRPNFEPILGTYYWIKYDTIIRGEPYKEITDEKKKWAEKIRAKYEKAPKFSPFYNLCIYFSDIYIENRKFEEAKKWLKYIRHYNDLNKTFKIGKETYYTPHKAKYFINYCKVCEENEIEKAIKICMKGLSIYPNLSLLKTSLVDLVCRQFNLKGKDLFLKLLSNIYFIDDKIRNNYLDGLISEEILSSWKSTNIIGQKIYELNLDFDTKNKKDWAIHSYLHKSISSSNISDYVFCPVSYSINKSIKIESDEHINIELDFSSKISIAKIYGNKNKFENIGKALHKLPSNLSLKEQIEQSILYGNTPYECYGNNTDFEEIFKLKLLETNARSKKRKFYSSNNSKFTASPDYIMLDEETGKKIIIEEKYRYAESSNIEQPFQNNYFEVLNTVLNIEEFHNYEVYIVYWFWKFSPNKKTDFEKFFVVTDWRVFKIQIDDLDKVHLDRYTGNIEHLLNNQQIEFNKKNLYAKKCAHCSVRHYCYHKTGRLENIPLPYNKHSLKIIEI